MNADSLSLKPLEQQFEELCSIINYHRSRASQAVNEHQLLTAWNVGAYVSNKLKTNEWGSKVVTQFVEYMKVNAPALKGYSRASIYNMVMFFDEYSSDMFLSIVSKFYPNEIVQTASGQLETTGSEEIEPSRVMGQAPTVQFV